MSGPSAEQKHQLVQSVIEAVDPRLSPGLRQELSRPGPRSLPAKGQTVVIGGHRSAGKTRLLPLVSALLERQGFDLDVELERRAGRPLREWVAADMNGFRAAERALLQQMPPGSVIAVGGGFLSNHPDALAGCYTLLVPITFETYRERLLVDTTRPRLRPGMSLEEELASVYYQRAVLHTRIPTVSLAELLRSFVAPGSQP